MPSEESIRGCDFVPVYFIVSGSNVNKDELALVPRIETWQDIPFVDLVASSCDLFSISGKRSHGILFSSVE